MNWQVPYLSRADMARRAEALLAAYGEKDGKPVEPPVPVEAMIGFLGLKCVYVNFERINQPGVLGATYVNRRLIAVSRDLLDESVCGRSAFTMAHEVGHWVLHRRLAEKGGGAGSGEEIIFCRREDTAKPVESQANYFAGCLLMPEAHVREAFSRVFKPERLDLVNVHSDFATSMFGFDFCVENWPRIAATVCEAGGFDNVSLQAMIIRLQNLGLVVNHTRQAMGWARKPGMTATA
ncbi:MAG: ImmA/IrrE family metallo-endopeptidase [Thermodesulfobacteriota bacterium]